MFEYFYDVYYMIYQFVTVDQNKDYYFCRLSLMLSHEHHTSISFSSTKHPCQWAVTKL